MASTQIKPRVMIELYGVPRVRAGRRECEVEAATVAEAIIALERECPALSGAVMDGVQLNAAYHFWLNGETLVTDPRMQLEPGDSLVLVAADAGG